MLAPALRGGGSVSLWPFDGSLPSLLVPGNVAVAETPQNATAGFPRTRSGASATRAKDESSGRHFSVGLRAATSCLRIASNEDIQSGLPQGEDAFDAVVGLFGMLQVCLGQRASGEPDDKVIREIEGWILGRAHSDAAALPRSRRFARNRLPLQFYSRVSSRAALPALAP